MPKNKGILNIGYCCGESCKSKNFKKERKGMSKILVIDKCTKCPYAEWGYNYFGCTQMDRTAPEDYIPDWCPLPDEIVTLWQNTDVR